MKLYINTISNTETILRFDNKEFVKEYSSPRDQSVLEFLDEKLKEENKKVEDITEIEVATGPGSFTGTRVGVSVAQALGYALKVPVNGKDVIKEFVRIKYD